MARQSCPCHCGRRVPFGKGGAAKAYIDLTLVMREAEDMFQAIGDDAHARGDYGKSNEYHEMNRQARRIQGELIDHLHQEAHPAFNRNLLELHLAQQVYMTLVANTLRAITVGGQ